MNFFNNSKGNRMRGPVEENWTEETDNFFKVAMSWTGSVSPKVMPRVLIFSFYSVIIMGAFEKHMQHWPLEPFEIFGAFVGLILVFRTNSGYERWWEARKLWGGVVNQVRNLRVAMAVHAHKMGRNELTHYMKHLALFPIIMKQQLRKNWDYQELDSILSPEECRGLTSKCDPSSEVLLILSEQLHQLLEKNKLNPFAFQLIEKERQRLMDHLGACQRILKTPIPKAYAIKVRRFILYFMILLPFGLIDKAGWFTPFIVFLISYPLFSLDQIGHELQNPFSTHSVAHLPLDAITEMLRKECLETSKDVIAKTKRNFEVETEKEIPQNSF